MPTHRELAEAELARCVLEAPELTESIEFWPANVESNAVTIENCVVVRGQEEGTNEVDGDGAAPSSDRGLRERRTYLVEMPLQKIPPQSVFRIDGETWGYIRTIGRDSSRMTVRVASYQREFTQRPRLRNRPG